MRPMSEWEISDLERSVYLATSRDTHQTVTKIGDAPYARLTNELGTVDRPVLTGQLSRMNLSWFGLRDLLTEELNELYELPFTREIVLKDLGTSKVYRIVGTFSESPFREDLE